MPDHFRKVRDELLAVVRSLDFSFKKSSAHERFIEFASKVEEETGTTIGTNGASLIDGSFNRNLTNWAALVARDDGIRLPFIIALWYCLHRFRLSEHATAVDMAVLGNKLDKVLNSCDSFEKIVALTRGSISTENNVPQKPPHTTVKVRILVPDEPTLIDPRNELEPSYSDKESDGSYTYVPLGDVRKVSSLLPPRSVNEYCENRIDFTQASPTRDPLGIVLALVNNRAHGLVDPTVAEELIRTEFQFRHAGKDLHEQIPEIEFVRWKGLHESSQLDFSGLIEPDPDFLLRLVFNHTNTDVLQKMLEQTVEDRNDLGTAAVICCQQFASGTKAIIGSYFFDQVSKNLEFNDFTRGMSLYIKSIFDLFCGSPYEAQYSCKKAIELIRSHRLFSTNSRDVLLARINSHRAAHIFTLLNPRNFDHFMIDEAMTAVKDAVESMSIYEENFEDPLRLIQAIEKHKDTDVISNQLFSCSLYHLIQAISAHVNDGDRHTPFLRNMEFNKALAYHKPRVACETLSPIATLANIVGEYDIARELYHWRHKAHEISLVDEEVKTINRYEKHTGEYTGSLLSWHNFARQELERGRDGAQELFDETKLVILDHQPYFEKTQVAQFARYSLRILHESSHDKSAYLASEMVSAKSHHMHVGLWEDELTSVVLKRSF